MDSVKFYILTLFPEMFAGVFRQSIIARAIAKKLIKIDLINLRDFASNQHRTVDDKSYGGGAGMVMKVDVIVRAQESIKPKPFSILLAATGRKYTQNYAAKLAKKPNIAVICGHYEGIDTRVEKFVDDVLSIGDFILTGGEIAAMAIVDSVTRLLPAVIDPASLKSESFSFDSSLTPNHPSLLLEYPQYTRPSVFRGLKVPSILLSGNHDQIAKWRQEQALARTKKYRPDLIKNAKS